MIKAFMFIFVMMHGQTSYKIVEAPSLEACLAARPEALKSITQELSPDKIAIECVQVTPATVT